MNNIYWRRIFAFWVDWIIGFGVFEYLFYYGPGVVREYSINPGIQTFKAPGFWLSIFWLLAWFGFKDCLFCRASIGKLIFGLKIVDGNTGKKAKFSQNILRNITLFILQVEIVVMFANKGVRLGDLWAKTRVVRRKSNE